MRYAQKLTLFSTRLRTQVSCQLMFGHLNFSTKIKGGTRLVSLMIRPSATQRLSSWWGLALVSSLAYDGSRCIEAFDTVIVGAYSILATYASGFKPNPQLPPVEHLFSSHSITMKLRDETQFWTGNQLAGIGRCLKSQPSNSWLFNVCQLQTTKNQRKWAGFQPQHALVTIGAWTSLSPRK